MKFLFTLCPPLLAFFFLTSTIAFAHTPGQVPYFKINNRFSPLYPVLLVPSSGKFTLPQDIAPETYRTGDIIQFDILKEQLPFTNDTISSAEFYWELGDGKSATGLSNTHRYTKQGSYILKVMIDYKDKSKRELLQSTLINILDHPSSKLPELTIKVDGQKFESKKGILTLNISKGNTFEAELNGSKNATYVWDMGDGTFLKGQKVVYKNNSHFLIINPVVRATSNGFIYDAEAIIQNNQKPKNNFGILLPLLVVNGSAMVLFSGFFLFHRFKKRSSSSMKH